MLGDVIENVGDNLGAVPEMASGAVEMMGDGIDVVGDAIKEGNFYFMRTLFNHIFLLNIAFFANDVIPSPTSG